MKRMMTIVLAAVLVIALLPLSAVPAMAAKAPKEIVLVDFNNLKDIVFVPGDVADGVVDGEHGVTLNNVQGLDKDPTTLFSFDWDTSIYCVTHFYITYDGLTYDGVINPSVTSGHVEIPNAKKIKSISFYYLDIDGSVAPLPEIATIGMFGIGLVGLGGFIWFRRNRKDDVIAG